ncbi:MAG TPA: hypothetical protein V6C81_25480 [Planktothrix sp.]|jgi:hypothetical protein
MIDSLTLEQESLLQQLEPTLRVNAIPSESVGTDAARFALERLYRLLGLKAPYVIWCDGPFQFSIMPLLLQMLVNLPSEQLDDKPGRHFGFDKLNALENELMKLLRLPRWNQALRGLLLQLKTETLFDLAYNDEERLPGMGDAYRQFAWSRCGISTADPLWKITRKSTDEIIQRLQQVMTLGLTTKLTNQLYTVPNDRILRTRQTIGRLLDREESLRLRDGRGSIFGYAQAGVMTLYRIAAELHEQISGTVFEDSLQSCPAPQAAPQYLNKRNLENEPSVNTAALMAFGPYEKFWGAWICHHTGCYAAIARMFPDLFSKELRSSLTDMNTLLRSGFAYIPLTRVVFVLRFPTTINVDDNERLHSIAGPALAFADGYGVYALHGIPVAASIVDEPESVTAQSIEKERNNEVRRVLIDRYGIANYLRDTGAGVVDRTDGAILYRKQQPNDEPITLVQVRNSTPEPDGTYKEYFLRVPPTMRSAREAVAWTFGMTADQYKPDRET